MEKLKKIRVLNKLWPFLRILTAYDSDHFKHNNWQRVYYTVFAMLHNSVLWTFIVLVVRYLIEIDANLELFAITAPKLMSILQMAITSLAMLLQRRNIIETIDCLQSAVNQRKCTSCW